MPKLKPNEDDKPPGPKLPPIAVGAIGVGAATGIVCIVGCITGSETCVR